MTNGKTVQAGFMVEIETWENDGDFYSTQTLQGLSEKDVEFCIEVCKYFEIYGNDIIDWDKINTDMNKIFANHSVTTGTLGQLITNVDDEDDFGDSISEILGNEAEDHGCYGDGSAFYRTVDSVKVFHTPVDIFLENVTENFRKSSVSFS